MASWLVAKLPGGEMTGYRDVDCSKDVLAKPHMIYVYVFRSNVGEHQRCLVFIDVNCFSVVRR